MSIKIENSSGGIVYKKEKNRILWLITQHSQHKGWGFPKGLIGDVQENESMEEAALREVGEEGGIKAKIKHRSPAIVKYTYQFQGYLVKKTVYYFLMEHISGDPKDHDWEVSDAQFLPEDTVKKVLTYASDKEAFEKILEVFYNISKMKQRA